MNEERQEKQTPLGKVIAKALQDEAFKRRLIADPAAVLEAEGIEIPAGIVVKVVEDSEIVRHLVLPAEGIAELSDDELSAVSGGGRKDMCWRRFCWAFDAT